MNNLKDLIETLRGVVVAYSEDKTDVTSVSIYVPLVAATKMIQEYERLVEADFRMKGLEK